MSCFPDEWIKNGFENEYWVENGPKMATVNNPYYIQTQQNEISTGIQLSQQMISELHSATSGSQQQLHGTPLKVDDT